MKNQRFKAMLNSVDKHIPEVLIGLGIAGVFVTAFLAVDGTIKAMNHVQDAKDEKFEQTGDGKLTAKETFTAVAKDYIPAVTAGTLTTACIASAYSEKAREASVFAIGYKGTLAALQDERGLAAKLKEAVGPKKTKEVEEEYAIEKAEKMPDKPSSSIPIIGKGTNVFKDTVQQREFVSDYETVRAAFNSFNEHILDDPFSAGVSWNDLNDCLGLDDSLSCDMWIYTTDDLPIKPTIGSTLDSSGNPCFALSYKMPTTLA